MKHFNKLEFMDAAEELGMFDKNLKQTVNIIDED